MSGINHKQCHHIYDTVPPWQDDDPSGSSTEEDDTRSTSDTSESKQTQDDSSVDTQIDSEPEPPTSAVISQPVVTPSTTGDHGAMAEDTDEAETLEVHSAHTPAHMPLYELAPGHPYTDHPVFRFGPTYTAHPWQHPTFRCDQAFHRRK